MTIKNWEGSDVCGSVHISVFVRSTVTIFANMLLDEQFEGSEQPKFAPTIASSLSKEIARRRPTPPQVRAFHLPRCLDLVCVKDNVFRG